MFDEQLATEYDETRGIGETSMRQLTATLRSELHDAQPCLEVGVGTGRISLPLHEAGIDVVGIDPSAPMLARLLTKGEGRPPFPLLRADALALPFGEARFGSALFCHVLHLIPAWQDAIAETVRILRPGGRLLVELVRGRDRTTEEAEVRAHFHQVAGVPPHAPLGVRDPDAVDACFRHLGWRGRELPTVIAERQATLRQMIDQWERGIHSSNRHLAEAERRRAAAATRDWAEARFGTLDRLATRERAIEWRAYEAVR